MATVSRKVCTRCGKNRALKFYRGERGHVCGFCRKRRTSTASRETRLWETYGITLAEYDELLAAQNGACAICEKVYRYNLDVDHDHELVRQGVPIRETIRGLLCKRCNRRMLPAASDKPSVLRRAAAYLEGGRGHTQAVLMLMAFGAVPAVDHEDNGA